MEEDWVYEGEEQEQDGQDEKGDPEDYVFEDFEITSSPNDFNLLTLYSFLESGVVKIPSFQRNFVWDINRSSKLIESLIIGLPIPQIFLYEESRNNFLIIDGQQRLMSIYYFIKGRFPKRDKRTEIGNIFDMHGKIPNEVLNDNTYFRPFNLKLVSNPEKKNKLDGLSYENLDEYQTNFNLRTVRNIIIKQNMPRNDNSSMYEIFNRLNSGGLNLRPQEIRSSLHHSVFDSMLRRINLDERWRKILGQENPDLRLRDVEILLRGFAMLHLSDKYKSPMGQFLNQYAYEAQKYDVSYVLYLKELFESFLNSCSDIDVSLFARSGKFNVLIFESIFSQICKSYLDEGKTIDIKLDSEKIERLINSPDFVKSSSVATANRENVQLRLKTANSILLQS